MTASPAGESTRTPQERAEALRIAADELDRGLIMACAEANVLRRMAEKLDPPEPDWTIGTHARLTFNTGPQHYTGHAYADWNGTDWVDANGEPYAEPQSVEPLPILSDKRVAVPRRVLQTITMTANNWREQAKYVDQHGWGNVATLVRAYADALDAADRARQQGQPTSTGGEA